MPLPTLVQPSVVFGGVGSGLEAGGATSQRAVQGADAEATHATTQTPPPTRNDTDTGIFQGAVPNAGATSSGDPGVFMATPPTMPSFGTVAGGSLPSASNVNGAGWPSGSANGTTWNGVPMPMDQGMQSLLQYLQQHQVHGHTTDDKHGRLQVAADGVWQITDKRSDGASGAVARNTPRDLMI